MSTVVLLGPILRMSRKRSLHPMDIDLFYLVPCRTRVEEVTLVTSL